MSLTDAPTEITPNKTENAAMKISELMTSFMRPSVSADREILDLVAQYSLQLSHEQQMILNRLQMVAMDERVPAMQRMMIGEFVEKYQQTKRYHDTMMYIGRAIDSFSLKRFMDNQSIKGQIIKTQ